MNYDVCVYQSNKLMVYNEYIFNGHNLLFNCIQFIWSPGGDIDKCFIQLNMFSSDVKGKSVRFKTMINVKQMTHKYFAIWHCGFTVDGVVVHNSK